MSTATNFLDVEMHIDDLAEFIFKRNINNAIVELSLGGVENTKDFFFFLLDLFCKGLVLLFGNETQSIDIDKLTEHDFTTIQSKMKCAGINVILTTCPCDLELQGTDVKSIINISEIEADVDDKPLNQYEFKVCSSKMLYIVSFEIVHHVV